MVSAKARTAIALTGTAMLFAPLLAAASPAQATASETVTYRITIVNGTFGQPFSPIVAATHRQSVHLFQVGSLASTQIAAIAQGGDESSAGALLESLPANRITDIVRPGQPLTPAGVTGKPFPSVQTFDIEARPGDRLSLATMLICTNDGFTGVDSIKLPRTGGAVVPLNAYDAGVERNTERSIDLVDPCSGLGPVVLPGDPNGNIDGAPVANKVKRAISMHTGVKGKADLLNAHDWGKGPVGSVTITRI